MTSKAITAIVLSMTLSTSGFASAQGTNDRDRPDRVDRAEGSRQQERSGNRGPVVNNAPSRSSQHAQNTPPGHNNPPPRVNERNHNNPPGQRGYNNAPGQHGYNNPPGQRGYNNPPGHRGYNNQPYHNAPQVYPNARHGERGVGPGYRYYRGDRLPLESRRRQYVVEDWRGHHLTPPPRGYHWVQSGGDYVLVAIATGIILQILLSN